MSVYKKKKEKKMAMEYARENWLGVAPAVVLVLVGGVQLGWGSYLMARFRADNITLLTDKEGKLYRGRELIEGAELLLIVSGSILAAFGLVLLGFHIQLGRRHYRGGGAAKK